MMTAWDRDGSTRRTVVPTVPDVWAGPQSTLWFAACAVPAHLPAGTQVRVDVKPSDSFRRVEPFKSGFYQLVSGESNCVSGGWKYVV